MYVCMFVPTAATELPFANGAASEKDVCMYSVIHVCMYVVYVCMYVCTYVSMYVCTKCSPVEQDGWRRVTAGADLCMYVC